MAKAKDPYARSPALSQPTDADKDTPQLGGDAALTHLVAAMNDPDPAVRARAIDALEQRGGSEAVIDLLIMGLNDFDVSMQHRAARALGRIGGEKALAALLAALESRSHLGSAGEILQSLGRIGGDQAFDTLMSYVNQRWGEALYHSDVKKGFRLMHQYHPDLLSRKLAQMLPTNDINLCSQLVQIAAMTKPPGLVEPMLALAADESQGIQTRRTAIRVLGKIGSPSAAPLMMELLGQGNRAITKWVADALIGIKKADITTQLMELFKSPDSYIASWAAKIVGNRKAESAVAPLIDLLADSRKEVRMRAVGALMQIRTHEAIVGVLPLLADGNTEVRTAVLHSIGRLPGILTYVPQLVPMLDSLAGWEHDRLYYILAGLASRMPNEMRPYSETLRQHREKLQR